MGAAHEEGVVTICRRLDEWESVCGETSPVSAFFSRQPPSLDFIRKVTCRYRYVSRLVRLIERPPARCRTSRLVESTRG